MVVMDFWMVKIGFYFKSSFEMIFFVFLKKFVKNEHVFRIFIWVFINVNFIVFSF